MHLGEVFTYSKCEIQRQVVALEHSERAEDSMVREEGSDL